MSTRFQKREQTALSGHKYMFKTKRRINSDFYREIGWDSITTKVFETTTRCLVVRNTWMKTSCLSKASSKTNQLMHPDIIPIVHLRKVHSSIKKPIQMFRGLEFFSISRKIATICTKLAMPYTKSRNSQEILGLKLQLLSKPLQNTLPIQTKMNHAESFLSIINAYTMDVILKIKIN